MRRTVLVVLLAAACSHPSPPPPPPKPIDVTPPGEKPVEAPPPVAKPTPPPDKPEPHDAQVPAQNATVKLVSPGKGKRVVAKIAPVAGSKTPVELHVDFAPTEGGHTEATPTMILRGDAEAVTADKTGTQWKLTIAGTDTHYTAGKARNDRLETGLQGIVGMTITGAVGSNGIADKLALHHDAVTAFGSQLMDLLALAWLPAWPALPAEAIAPGAKWQTQASYKLADQLDVSETADYELVAYKNKTWTIKATSKITGADQQLEGAPVTGIAGSGSLDATLVDGALVPTVHGTRRVTFQVTVQGQAIPYALAFGNDIGADSASLQMQAPASAGSGAAH